MTKPIMGTTAGATQLRLKFSNTGAGQLVDGSATSNVHATTRYVDVARLLSQANHRLYRQGRMYMIRVGFQQQGSDIGATVSALPNTWMTRKAWLSARKAYLKAMRDSGVKKQGRWNDFRLNYDDAQYEGNGTVPYQYVTLSGASITGDIDMRLTQVAGDSGSNEGSSALVYQFHASGATSTADRDGATGSFGMIAEYSVAEDTVTDDPRDDGTSQPFNELNSDSIMASTNEELAIETGDNPPYDPDQLENSRSVDYTLIQKATDSIGPVTPWIAAPLGLLKITDVGSSLGSNAMYIEVMSGGYKGVLSEAI